MTLTKKQHDEITRNGVGPLPLLKALNRIVHPVLRLLARIGFVRRYIERTAGARFGAIFRCQKRGDHEKAVELAIDALTAFRDRKPGRFDFGHLDMNWWTFMHSAVYSLRKCNDPERWETAIALARDGIEPFEGYFVAYAFESFTRLRLSQRDYTDVVDFATIASRADETWPEPDLLLAWYEVSVVGGDAIAHLNRAVRKDRSVLSRISDDPAFQQNPHVAAWLEEHLSEVPVSAGDDPAPGED